MPRVYYVYILASRSRVLYTGVTNNMAYRLLQHQGKASTFTARYNVNRLVYAEQCSSILDAIAREKQIKGWVRRRKVALVEAANPEWDDLSTFWHF